MIGRVTVVEQVYHRCQGEKPTAAPSSRFWRALGSSEQPYQRDLVASVEWKKLDLGWVPQPGLLLVYNLEGKHLATNPSEDERKDIALRVLELSYAADLPGWLILPGESFRGCPSNAAELMIRSRHGMIRYSVFAVPS